VEGLSARMLSRPHSPSSRVLWSLAALFALLVLAAIAGPQPTRPDAHQQSPPTRPSAPQQIESAVWQPLNDGLPGYAFVTAILLFPPGLDGQTEIVVAAYDREAGIYRSDDGGASWHASDSGLAGAAVFTLIQDPGNPRTIYAGTVAGIYSSADRGLSWEHLGAPDEPVYTFLFDRYRPGVLYAGTAGAVLESSDGGMSWTKQQDGLDGVAVLSLAQTDQPGVLYAGTNGGGIMSSRDGGTWVSVYPTTTVISSVVADPFLGRHLMARAQDTLLHSVDGGVTWEPVRPGPQGRLLGIVFDPAQKDVVYALTASQGVLVSRDSGATWQALGHGLAGHAVYAVTIPNHSPYNLLAATTHGIWGMTAEGSWVPLGGSLGAPIVRALAFSPQEELVAGTTNGLFRHQGGVWERVGDGLVDVHILSVAFDPLHGRRILLGTWGNGVQVSSDGGITWRQTTGKQFTNSIIPRLTVDQHDPGNVYARVEYARLLISRNGGDTWQESSLPITVTVFAIAIAPSDGSRLYVGTDHGVYRSLDHGEHWEALLGPPGVDSILALAVDPEDADVVYAGSEAGLHRSLDGGHTWEQAAGLSDMTVTALVVHPADRGTIYAGTRYRGVFVSMNRGATWVPIGEGLDRGSVNDLAIDAAADALYAGTEAGVYVLARPLSATSTPLPQPTEEPSAACSVTETGSTVSLAMHTLDANGTLMSLVREAGFDAIVQLIAWRDVEPEKGKFLWESSDAVVRAAEFYGLKLVLRVDFQPLWARNTWANAPPEHLEDYGDFVGALATRYRGRVKGYIIWNEPNLALEWGGAKPDPEGYAALLKIAYWRIKQADPRALVVSAGLAPTNEQNDQAVDDRVFLRALYAAGAKEFFDVLGAHPYGFGYPPDDPHGAHDGLNFARLEDLRQIMEANGDEAKPVWITEFGWTTEATDPTHAWQVVSEEQQASYLVRACQKVMQEWPWVRLLAVWNLSVGLAPGDQMRGYSVIDNDYRKKPAYDALQRMAAKRGDARAQSKSQTDQPERRVEILAPDVVIHLGDQDDLVWPWVHISPRYIPATEWRGEFFVRTPGSTDWTLTLDGFQLNEWGNTITVNGQPLDPRFLPGRVNDWAGYWTRLHFRVPAGVLRPGLNWLTIRTSMNAPVHQAHGISWEDLQIRNIFLMPD